MFFFLLLITRRRQQSEIGMKTVASDQLYLWASGEFLSGVGALYLLLCDNDDIEESERERESMQVQVTLFGQMLIIINLKRNKTERENKC
jgi:hypothetical protein